jgi:hypothetical protein
VIPPHQRLTEKKISVNTIVKKKENRYSHYERILSFFFWTVQRYHRRTSSPCGSCRCDDNGTWRWFVQFANILLRGEYAARKRYGLPKRLLLFVCDILQ